MYMRFVTPLIHPRSRVESGFFRASWYVHRNGSPAWIRHELDEQFTWFNRHLPLPGRVARHFKRRNGIWGICWFNPQAGEAISRARYCAWLLEEAGLPVRVIRSRCDREVIWRDADQIVSKPTADLPRAFA